MEFLTKVVSESKISINGRAACDVVLQLRCMCDLRFIV